MIARALSLLLMLAAGCTAVQHRHVVDSEKLKAPPEPVPGRVLEDFSEASAHERWTPYEVEGSINPLALSTQDGALHLISDSSAGLAWRQLGFDPGTEPLLTWRWKVSTTYGTSNPLSPELDNFPARVLVGFNSGWEGANSIALTWRKRVENYTGVTPPARALCYTFGGTIPSSEAVDATFGDGRIAVINLRTPNSGTGVWHSEVRDIGADYRAVFREAPPPVTAMALGCDSHRVRVRAEAWFDDIMVYPVAALPQFRAALGPTPTRVIPPLTWLIVGGATGVAGLTAGAWFWLRRRDMNSARG